jgi:anthranilate synthase/aminodeoxychorismate synthase-like glutamine amidotransferase
VTRVLVVDNYDSFTFNLVQYLGMAGARCDVVANDAIDAASACARAVDGILISPGPCAPDDAGVSLALIAAAAGRIPLLGVCLGHQAIAQVFGGKVVRAALPMHGKTSPIEHDGATLFAGIERPFEATRYHSLVVERASVPSCLEITATSDDGLVMGLRHRDYDIEGVQFHPESILTAGGHSIVANFLAKLG